MKSKDERRFCSIVIYLSLIAGALICAWINHLMLSDAFLHTGYALVIGTVFLVLLERDDELLWKQIPDKPVYILTVAVSLCLSGVASRYSVGFYWLLPLAVVGCLQALEIRLATFGLVMLSYLCNAVLVQNQIQPLMLSLIMGITILLIFSMLKDNREVPYAGVILLAMCLALSILAHRFEMRSLWQDRYQVILEVSSLLFMMLWYAMLHERRDVDVSEYEEEQSLEQRLMEMMSDEFDLMHRLKQVPGLYQHSFLISSLSGEAAGEIAANRLLALAGGMYHDAGKLINEENYMEGDMALARQYEFPTELMEVIRQHNTGSELPKSPEAAIVMLSDCIISTGDYLEKNGKRGAISNEKLVKSIFANRIAKGSLKDSGLSEEELERLQSFYEKNAFTEKRKDQ